MFRSAKLMWELSNWKNNGKKEQSSERPKEKRKTHTHTHVSRWEYEKCFLLRCQNTCHISDIGEITILNWARKRKIKPSVIMNVENGATGTSSHISNSSYMGLLFRFTIIIFSRRRFFILLCNLLSCSAVVCMWHYGQRLSLHKGNRNMGE